MHNDVMANIHTVETTSRPLHVNASAQLVFANKTENYLHQVAMKRGVYYELGLNTFAIHSQPNRYS